MLKKVAIFWVDKFRVVIFLGIQYEPLSDSPPPGPPSLKFVSGAPGMRWLGHVERMDN